MSDLSKKVIELGGKEWEKNGMHRVYITCDILNILREEKDLAEVSYGERNNKIFLDVKTGSVMRSYKNKKPAVEL